MISMDKKYRTRDGREVRIYSVDGGGMLSVHGAIKCLGGWMVSQWCKDGLAYPESNAGKDLIEVKPEIVIRQYLRCLDRKEPYYDMVPRAEHRMSPFRTIGAIDITHDGEKIIKVEIVK